MFHHSRQEEKERTDHPEFVVEIGVHQNSAEYAWEHEETYQEATVYYQDHASEFFRGGFAERQGPRADRSQKPTAQLDAIIPAVRGGFEMLRHQTIGHGNCKLNRNDTRQ